MLDKRIKRKDRAFAYLRKIGMGKHRRGSNSESGMRLRQLEKNHDGIRSAPARQHYVSIRRFNTSP